MLRMSVILFIGILFASGNEDIRSIETISDVANKTNLENSKIVMIKIKPDLTVNTKRSESNDKAESKSANDQEFIYVDVITDITEDLNTNNDPTEPSQEINVNTRRFLTEKDLETVITPVVREESRTSDQETSTIDEFERTAEKNPTETSANQEISTIDVTVRTADDKLTEQNLNAASKAATEIDVEIVSGKSSEKSTEAPTRRSHHHNSSVLNNVEKKKEKVSPKTSEHKVEIVRQGSEVIKDVETVPLAPLGNTRRRFNNDLEYYPELITIDDDRIESAKSIENARDVLLDTRARSGMPDDDFDIPGPSYFYSEPYNNYQHYDAKTDYHSYNTKTVTGYQPQNLPNAGYQPQNLPNTGYQPQNLPNAGYQPQKIPNTGYQPQNLPIVGYQPYINKHVPDYPSHNIKPVGSYQTQNIPLSVYQPNDIDATSIGGYQPHNTLPISGYQPYNIRPHFDFNSDPFYYNLKPNIEPQPQTISQPYNAIPITGYQPYSNEPMSRYSSHNINQFTGYQPKLPSLPISDYLPQYDDNTNPFAGYKPNTPMTGPQPIINYKPYGIHPIGGNRLNMIPTPDHQFYNNKPAMHYEPYDAKFTGRFTDPPHHNIKPNVGYQTFNKAGFQPYNIKPTLDVQPYDTIPIRSYPHYNIKPDNVYQQPNIHKASYQSYNKRPGYQQYKMNTLKPFGYNQPYVRKDMFDNQHHDIPLVDYNTQDTSHLGPLRQTNQQNFHPVYANHQHYIPQNLQQPPSGINANLIQMSTNLGFAQNGCKNRKCNPLPILAKLGYNGNVYRPEIHGGVDLNANGYYRSANPYNSNARVISRINPYQYPGHFINVRNINSNRTSETNYTSSEDEVYYDDYDNNNNYPHFTRHSENGRTNIYHHESSNSYESQSSETYESRASNNNLDESKVFNSAESRRPENNPFELRVSNLYVARNLNNIPFETSGSNNNPFETKGLNNGPINDSRRPIPYELQAFNNSPERLRGPNFNHYEPQSPYNNPYDSRSLSSYESQDPNNSPYESQVNSSPDPAGSNLAGPNNSPYDSRRPSPHKPQDTNRSPDFRVLNINPYEYRGPNNSPYDSRDASPHESRGKNNSPDLRGSNINPYEYRGPDNSPFDSRGPNPLEPQRSNDNLFEPRRLYNNVRGLYDNAFEPMRLFINPNESKGLVNNPYESKIGSQSDRYIPPPMFKRFYIGG